ncbi:MAG: NAD-dependent epimerase/dehydratase family protein [Paracoccaceae bacterium]
MMTYGDGSQTRSFCYVDDMVDGLMRLMASDEKMPEPGNPGEFTMLELARMVRDKIGRSLPTYLPLPQDDPRQRRPDISRAHDILAGWATKAAGSRPGPDDRPVRRTAEG